MDENTIMQMNDLITKAKEKAMAKGEALGKAEMIEAIEDGILKIYEKFGKTGNDDFWYHELTKMIADLKGETNEKM